MNNLSRREFIIKAAALSAAFPFVKLGVDADPWSKPTARTEDLVFSSAVDAARAIRRGEREREGIRRRPGGCQPHSEQALNRIGFSLWNVEEHRGEVQRAE